MALATRATPSASQDTSLAVLVDAESGNLAVYDTGDQLSSTFTLVIMSQREVDARAKLLQLAADLIITVTLDDEGTLATRMVQKFEWMRALSTADQEACARDLIHAARASFATGQAHLALAELTSWRETAAAVAAGLTGLPVEWLEDPAPAERP